MTGCNHAPQGCTFHLKENKKNYIKYKKYQAIFLFLFLIYFYHPVNRAHTTHCQGISENVDRWGSSNVGHEQDVCESMTKGWYFYCFLWRGSLIWWEMHNFIFKPVLFFVWKKGYNVQKKREISLTMLCFEIEKIWKFHIYLALRKVKKQKNELNYLNKICHFQTINELFNKRPYLTFLLKKKTKHKKRKRNNQEWKAMQLEKKSENLDLQPHQ